MEMLMELRGRVLNGRAYDTEDEARSAAGAICTRHCGEGNGGQHIEHDPEARPWCVNVYRSATQRTYVQVVVCGAALMARVENEAEAGTWAAEVLRRELQRALGEVEGVRNFASAAFQQCERYDDVLREAMDRSGGVFTMVTHTVGYSSDVASNDTPRTTGGDVLH